MVARWTPFREVLVRALAGITVLAGIGFLGETLQCLSTQMYKWIPANLMLSRNTPSCFMLRELEISVGLMCH